MFFLNTIDGNDTGNQKFAMSRFMEIVKDQYDPFWSYMINKIRIIPSAGSYQIGEEEHRAELLSYNLYGVTTFWWFLLLYNRKICPFDLTRGEYIKYPSRSHIDDFYMYLREMQATHSPNTRYI